MDGDSSEDDCNFTTVFHRYKFRVAHSFHRGCEECAFLRFRRFRP